MVGDEIRAVSLNLLGKMAKFIPLGLRELRGFGCLARAYLPPCGGESEIEELARSGPNLRFCKRGAW
jgi:hypothetical protein